MDKPPHGAIVIVAGGSPSGGSPGDPSTLGSFKKPKGFDPGDAKPGDEMEVTCKVRLSSDGQSFDVLSVDGNGQDEQEDTSDTGDDSDEQGDEDSPGARWDKIRKPSAS